MPRLILEARRVAATVIHGLHGRRRAGPGENFWQFRRFVSGEPAQRVDWRRSARDDHLYVREQEWEAAHTVWIWPDRSPSMAFASRAGVGNEARPRARRRVRARRGAGRGRRAHRHSRHHAADREPQRDRADGRGDRPRPDRAREPAAVVLALAARRGRGAVRPVEPDRRGARDHRAALGHAARTATWCRSSIRPRRPSRIPVASSSSSRKARAPSRPAAPRPGASSTRSGWSVTAPRSAPRPTGSAGRSRSTAPTGPPPTCCCGCIRSMGAGPRGTGINRWHALPASGRLAMMGLPLAFAEPLVLLGVHQPAGAVVAACG